MSASIVYMTAANKQEAELLATSLVNEGLLACANIFDHVTSIYKWDNKIVNDSEVVVIGKTLDAVSEHVITRVKELHSYDCPCVVTTKIENASQDYLKWLETSVKLPY